jgi:hypothetical protein
LAPASRAAFGVHDLDDDDTVRAKVFNRMRTAATALSDEQATAVAVAFGLEPDCRGRFYKDRVAVFAQTRDVSSRTVRRWVDRGLEQLARSLLTTGQTADTGPGWWTDELRLSLALDQPSAESLEVRRVVAARDGIAELDLAVTVTDADPRTVLEQVSFRVFYGGTLRVGPMESSDRVGMVLALPTPLRQGEAHEFALRTRLPADHDMRRHYVCVPRYRCARLDMRVRFPIDLRPAWIGKLVDVYQRDIDDTAIATEHVSIDAAGEVRVGFTHLTPHRATGLRWQY